jgi:opacity protein-like surface antigen
MKKIVMAALAAAGLIAVTPAYAQQANFKGWYGQVSAGYLQLQDVDGSISGTSVKGEYESGWALTGAVGYAYGNGLRTELEGGYGRTGYDSVNIGGTKVDLNGDINMWSLYGAGYYDFNVGSVKPYVGGGIGVVRWDVDNVSATVGGTTFTGSGGNGSNFSAFGEAGLSFALSERLDLVPAVRYIWVDDGDSNFDNDTAWLFKVGLRYKF